MKKILIAATLSLMSASVIAEESSALEDKAPPKIGAITSALLKAQADGIHASDNPQSATPVIQEKAIERHLHTYSHQIPDFYERDVFISSGN